MVGRPAVSRVVAASSDRPTAGTVAPAGGVAPVISAATAHAHHVGGGSAGLATTVARITAIPTAVAAGGRAGSRPAAFSIFLVRFFTFFEKDKKADKKKIEFSKTSRTSPHLYAAPKWPQRRPTATKPAKSRNLHTNETFF